MKLWSESIFFIKDDDQYLYKNFTIYLIKLNNRNN